MESTLDHILVIEAGKTERQYWADLWRYRELFAFLAWRDILVRYKQTAIGVAWSVIRPLLTMIIFTFIFSRLAHLPSGGAPYPILVFAGMLPWQFFSNGLTEGSGSLITNANMVSKIYFPRVIVPSSAVIASIADLLITIVILFVLMALYRFPPRIELLALPIFTLLAIAATIGPTLLLNALTGVVYRPQIPGAPLHAGVEIGAQLSGKMD